jgi:ParB-like nuclease domain
MQGKHVPRRNKDGRVKPTMKFQLLPQKAIKVGRRYRTDDGDIDELARSIADVGLLQPIIVDEYYTLIGGFRRARAWFEILKREDPIPAVVVSLESILAGEFAENEFRKAFTKTERIAIGKAVEEEAGERQGKRTDLSPDSTAIKLEENFPQGHGKRRPQTRDLAAKVAGFKNPRTYEQAKRAVNKGTPELTAAMDSGEVSVFAASKIALQPPAEQRRILTIPKNERCTALARIATGKVDRELQADIDLFLNFSRAVTLVATFTVDGSATWMGINRHYVPNFPQTLEQAITCLLRIREASPNEPKRKNLLTPFAKAT